METRWLFHRMEMPLDGVPHFDMLHPARRLWKARADDADRGRLPPVDARAHAVRRAARRRRAGFEIPSRFFQFMRTRRSAAARAGARAQPARSGLARRRHGARRAAGRGRRRRMSRRTRRRWPSAGSTSAPGSSSAPTPATGARRTCDVGRGQRRSSVSARPALPPRTPVRRSGRALARDRRADRRAVSPPQRDGSSVR